MPPPTARVPRASSFSLHFLANTKMLALTIMAIKSSQPRFPFRVGFLCDVIGPSLTVRHGFAESAPGDPDLKSPSCQVVAHPLPETLIETQRHGRIA
jgi:hypothetical protein